MGRSLGALVRILSAFCALCCVCCRSWLVFARLAALWGQFSSLRGGFWRVSEGSGDRFWGQKRYFFSVVARLHACSWQKLPMRKNHGFSQVFAGFLHIASFLRTFKNDTTSLQEPSEQRFPPRSRYKFVLGLARLDLGGIWGHVGRLLDATWPALGRSWAALGPSWALLGRILDASWALLGVSWLVWDGSWPHFGSRERSRPRF